MRLTWLLSLPAVLSVVSAMAIQKRDADFISVRTKMTKDMSGRRGDPKGKYFHESIFHPHYDGRFAEKQLGYRERKAALSNLVQTYLATFADIGVETWLMHGTLLGWWWNRKILPWDSDSDVQVTEASMHYLATYYNMSVFHYKTPRIPEGRDYMLEVNPHYVNREQTDNLNVIDARWVDTTSGLFIDITTARYNSTHPAGVGMLSCKDGHEYRDSYIFPLRDTYFEGAPAKIPFAYKEVLEAEYQERALTLQDFEGHHFDENKFEWVPVPKKIEPPKKEEEKKPDPAKERIPSPPPAQAAPPQKPPAPKADPPAQNTPPKQQPATQPAPPPAEKPKAEIVTKEAPPPPPAPAQKPSAQPAAPAAAKPQDQKPSPAPAVVKKTVEVDPKKKAAEEKARAVAEKQKRDLDFQAEKRKSEEMKAISKKEKRIADEQKALKQAEDKKAQKAAQEKIAAEKKAQETTSTKT